MTELIIANSFISQGLYEYFNNSSASSFEAHIIECLCDIYGEDKIKKTFTEKNDPAFSELIHSYGLKNSVYDNFLRDTNAYNSFKISKEQDPSIKTDLLTRIESYIITMFLYKCLTSEATDEEISHFENDLLNNFNIIKLHFNMSNDPSATRNLWAKKKKLLMDEVELVEIVPEYLDEYTYSKFGTSLDIVKKMDYRMVEELNSYIKSKLEVQAQEDPKSQNKKKSDLFRNTAISSGNGFVDALLITSIIVTEISIGIIYFFLHM